MALYSASLKTISRSDGRSATAAAAYRLGCEIADERTGLVHDYTRKGGVETTFAFAPAGTIAMSAQVLWNSAESAEKRKNSTVCREFLVALPHELDAEQRRALALSISTAIADRYGVAGSVGIHRPDKEGDQRNHHAHILFTTRVVAKDGTLGAKTRVLDDMKTGPAETLWLRQLVERETNGALAKANVVSRVDSRSLKDQYKAALDVGNQMLADSLDRSPTMHEGPRVTQIRREAAKHGRSTHTVIDRIAANDEIHEVRKAKLELVWINDMLEKAEKTFTRAADAAKLAVVKTKTWIDDLLEKHDAKSRKNTWIDDLEERRKAKIKAPTFMKVSGESLTTNVDVIADFFEPEPKLKKAYVPTWTKGSGVDFDP